MEEAWPERFKKYPALSTDTHVFERIRRMAIGEGITFESARSKFYRWQKRLRADADNKAEVNKSIDPLGILKSSVSTVWTKEAKDGTITHSILHKPGEGIDIDRVIEAIKDYKFTYPKSKPVKETGFLGVINIFDAHIDKVSIVETSNHKSSLIKNIEHFQLAFIELFEKCYTSKAEKVIMPIGNDFFNADNAQNTTFAGTPQHSEFDWNDSYTRGLDLIRWCVDYSISRGMPIDLILVKCNHAPTKSWYMAITLKYIFESCPLVNVDTQWIAYKYVEYGKNMLGFTHGNFGKENDWSNTMSTSQPEMWGRTRHRVYYVAHFHKGKVIKYKSHEDKPGVELHFLRSFADGADEWHFGMGYIGIPKTATAHIHSKEKGIGDVLRVSF